MINHPVNATPADLLSRVYDPQLKFWHDLCGPCTAKFREWQCKPNPANWNNPRIAENPYLLGFLQACRAAGPTPEEWRRTISEQLLLIRQVCTENKDGTHGEYVPVGGRRPVTDVPLPLDSSQANS